MKKCIAAVILLIAVSLPAWSTWSIIAVDPETGEVGSAGASYTPSVWPILGLSGGNGVVVAQASGNEKARIQALRMLEEGIPAEEIMTAITDPEKNKNRGNQQFGVIAIRGGGAGFTGEDCTSWAGHAGNDLVMVQGNILVSEAVVADTLSAFKQARADGGDLADALLKGLAAGSAAGGDSRAGDPKIAAMSAYLAVADPYDAPGRASFAIIVPPLKNGGNPVKELERLYAEKEGNASPLFFPSLLQLLILFIGIPAFIGIAGFSLFSSWRKRTGGLKVLRWAASIFVSLIAQQIIIAVLSRMDWALPIYGYYSRIYPAMLSVILIICFLITTIVSRVKNRRD